MYIDINKILPNPEQPRTDIDQEYINDLANSIKQHGLINPISVESVGDYFVLIDGECRWRAAQLAGLTTIEASVRNEISENSERLVMAVVGNVQRRNMNPIDQALAFRKLSEAGNSIDDIADLVNMSSWSIKRYLSILDLPIEVQFLYQTGKLKNETNGLHAIQSINDESLQIKVAQVAAKNELSGPQISRLIKRMRMNRRKKNSREDLCKCDIPQNDQHWNMLVEANLDIEKINSELKCAAVDVCRVCMLYDIASHATCKDCPAVELVKKIAFSGVNDATS